MAGSPGIQLAPDLPEGSRAALVIATTSYQDPELRQLRAPAHDALGLAEVLADPGIGGFTVTSVIDADERQARRAIAAFLSGRGVGDVVVVYLSCHGVLDRRNRLYFAAADTMKSQLAATGIASAWLLDQLEDCRARQRVLILDCCFSSAFAHSSKGDADLDLERRLVGRGRGQAVLTASRASEYSFEGQALPGAAVSGSVFTAGLVEGLCTGDADAGGDGYISVDEAYDYAYRYVQSSGASQTPQRWLFGGEGAIVLARSPAGIVINPAALPQDLAGSLDSLYPRDRIGAVHELGGWLAGNDPARAVTAKQKLREIADTDNPAVAAASRAYLASPDRMPREEADRKPRHLAHWTREVRDDAVAAGNCRGWIGSPNDGDTVGTRFAVRGGARNVLDRHHFWLAHRVDPGGLLWPKDAVSETAAAKFEAVVDDVAERRAEGQPVLVGTASVEKSEVLSRLLKRRGIPHEVLNAKYHEREAVIVAQAGRKGAVTVAADIAGRGTDIMLGGSPEFIADTELHQRGLSPVETPDDYERAWPAAVERAKRAVAEEHEEVVLLGGLYVLETEQHAEITLDQNGHFDVYVYEAGSSPRLYVALLLVTAKLSADFDKWIAESSRTGHHPGLRPPQDSYVELATVSLWHERF